MLHRVTAPLALSRSPQAGQYAAASAILAASVLLLFDSRLTLDFARTIDRLEKVTLTAGRQIAVIAAIILCASLIISVLGQTGLGVKVTSVFRPLQYLSENSHGLV